MFVGTLAGAQAQTNLRLAHASSTNSLIHDAVKRFAADVKERSTGQLTVALFPDGQLGDAGPIAEGVGSGAIDIGLGGVIDAIDTKLGAVTLPFLFSDAKSAHAFLDGPVGKSVFEAGANRGYKMLGALDSGFRQFATSARPINAPADLRNLKIRTPPNPVILATIETLGALPQAVPFGEVYTSLQSKVVDGVEPEMRDFWDQKWYELAKVSLDLELSLDTELLVHEQGSLRQADAGPARRSGNRSGAEHQTSRSCARAVRQRTGRYRV